MHWSKWIGSLKRNLQRRIGSVSADQQDIDADLYDGYAGEEMVRTPVEDWIDLHHYHPRDLGPLLGEYFELCRRKGLLEVRVIHGKGSGMLRAGVHALLANEFAVESYRLASAGEGEWGATIVRLKPWPRNY